MSTRRARAPVRQSTRGRPPRIDRTKSWEDPEILMNETSGTRRSAFKHCCRSVATFMCTQVGVGGIIVMYALVGAWIFVGIETYNSDTSPDAITLKEVNKTLIFTADELLQKIQKYQFSKSEWFEVSNKTLLKFQDYLVYQVKIKGYDGKTAKEKWQNSAALMFTLSIFTMVGFGNLVPRTDWGKVITIMYAIVGIPLYVLYFMNMGKALASFFKWMYKKCNSCSLGRKGSSESVSNQGSRGRNWDEEEEPLVPSSASIYVLVCYITGGTIMFKQWEDWQYLDAIYFSITSLCKIGFGDFVPGTKREDTGQGKDAKLYINFVYLLVGLGLVAMCYNLLKEEVLAKLKRVRSDLRDLFTVLHEECKCFRCRRK